MPWWLASVLAKADVEVDAEQFALENFGPKSTVVIIGLGCLAVSWLVYFYVWPDSSPPEPSVEDLRQILSGDPSQSSGAASQTHDRVARGRAASKLGAMRDEDSMPLLLKSMEDPDPLIRGRAGAAVQKIMKADYYFRAEDPPQQRQEALARIKGAWEGYLRRKNSSVVVNP